MAEKIVRSKWLLIIVFIVAVLVMTAYEVLKETFFQGTLTTWQSHTITIIVTSVIAVIVASVMQSWVLKIYLKQKEIESKQQAMVSFTLVVQAVNHIVNNMLNYLQVIKLELEQDGSVKEESMALLEKSLQDANRQMKILNQIENPQDPESFNNIFPH